MQTQVRSNPLTSKAGFDSNSPGPVIFLMRPVTLCSAPASFVCPHSLLWALRAAVLRHPGPGHHRLRPGRGVGRHAVWRCLATPPTAISPPAPAELSTAPGSNITAAVAPVGACLLFMVIAVKGFGNISSHPSLFKTDILTYLCGMPA